MRRTAVLLCLAALASCSRLTHTRTFTVQSASMEPSIRLGDRISCSTRVPDTLRHGQVVAYRGTGTAAGKHLVKRVVAVGGETVEGRKDELVYVDGKPLDEPYADRSGSPEFPPTTVPAGTYFVLGDDRDRSSDSRFNGPVPAADVEAVCTRILSPGSHRGRIPGTP